MILPVEGFILEQRVSECELTRIVSYTLMTSPQNWETLPSGPYCR
jgi:hypothetical protein